MTDTLHDREDQAATTGDHADVPRTNSRWGLWVLIGITVAPVLAAAVLVIGHHWHAGGDNALQVLRVSDVGTRHTPIVGAWSRWGWAHPGPLLFWYLAPFFRLSGATGLLVGMGLLNAACAGATVAVAHRRAGVGFAAMTAVVVALLVHAEGLTTMLDPWNPYAAFLPFVLFLLLAWSCMSGDMPMLPWAIAVGSFVVQAHIGYVVFVVGALLLAAAVRVRRWLRSDRDERRAVQRWVALGAVVGVVLWLPSLVDEVAGTHNLTSIVSFLRHPSETAVGWASAFGSAGVQLRVVGPWVTGNDISDLGLADTGGVWQALLVTAAAAAAGGFAWRRGRRAAAELALLALVLIVLATWSTANVVGLFAPYLLRWWWGITGLTVLAIAWIASGVASERRSQLVTGACGIALAAVSVVSATQLPADLPLDNLSRVLTHVGGPTAAALDRQRTYLVHGVDERTWTYTTSGLFLELEQRGIDVRADPRDNTGDIPRLQYGSWRLALPEQVDGVVTIVETSDADLAAFQPGDGARVVASYDPLTPQERDEARAVEARIRAALGVHAPRGRILLDSPYSRGVAVDGGASPADVARLHELQVRGDGYVVYVEDSPGRS